MKNYLIIIIAIAVVMVSCGPAKEKGEKERRHSESMQDSIAKDSIAFVARTQEEADSLAQVNSVSSSAAVQSKKDTVRKFIRTAELKFKAKNVYQSSLKIEKIVAEKEGFVTYTNLRSTIDGTSVTPISPDSSLETTYYIVENDIVVRVPNYNLDSTIREISKLIQYLDYRIIKADDVTLLLAANNLGQQKLKNNTRRITRVSDEKGINPGDKVKVVNEIYDKEAHLDRLFLERMQMINDINLSTLKIKIYQRQVFRREMVENDKNIKAYKPGFWKKAKNALVFSYNIILDLAIFILQISSIILLLLLVWLIVRSFFRKKRNDDEK